MINRFANLSSRIALIFAMLIALAACGGGGGGGGDNGGGFLPDNDTDVFFVSITLLDAEGNPTNTVTSTQDATVVVTVTRNGPNGAPIVNEVVTATSDIGVVNPESGTALTDEDGIARLILTADPVLGAGTITITVSNAPPGSEPGTINFQVIEADLRLGSFVEGVFVDGVISIAPEGIIAARGTAVLTLAAVDQDGNRVETEEEVTITSECLVSGEATLNPVSPITFIGQISTEYTNVSCAAGEDVITATLGNVQATGTVTVAPPSANSLVFTGADPEVIVLRGTSINPEAQESSVVTFQAVDSGGAGIPGVEVSFDLTTFIGGLSLSPTSAVTDVNGNVNVKVFAGDVTTVVRVIATALDEFGDGEVSTVSGAIAVSAGVPDQKSISLSVEGGFVVEDAFNTDGVTRTLTVRMADRLNNSVPDGTFANFSTEYGVIEPSCQTVDGACSVVWTSQNPRLPALPENQALVKTIWDEDYSCPSHNGDFGPCPDSLGDIQGGRSTVQVTSPGEESYIDRNGNNIFDQAEADANLFSNLTEAHLDHNEDGDYNPATQTCIDMPDTLTCLAGSEEPFRDRNSNGVFDANGDNPDDDYPDTGEMAVYNGLGCPPEGDGIWCSRELVDVRASTVLILSDASSWAIELFQSARQVTRAASGVTYTAFISDIFNNAPPAGSTVTVSTEGECAIEGESSFEVPVTAMPGAFEVGFRVGGEGVDASTLTITLDPEGNSPNFTRSYPCVPLDPNGLVVGPG